MAVPRWLWVHLIVTLTNLTPVLANGYPETTDSKCICYLTNTTTKNWFSHHKFFDFRNMGQYVNVSTPLQDPGANAAASVTSSYFSSPDWKNYWSIQNWNNNATLNSTDASVYMVNSPNNIYFENNKDSKAASKTYLTLRTVRHQNFQSAAEFESSSGGYHYVSMRMFARTRGPSGAITAMFTYRGAPSKNDVVQEADLEVRTMDPPDSIQYTNQPSFNDNGEIPQATRNVTDQQHVNWSDWQYHRIDWNPGSSNWFINGQLMTTISFQAPRDPTSLIFNSWSDGGSWSGNMTVGSEAYLQIQWIDVVYNNTNAATIPRDTNAICNTICSIDETSKIGTPVLLPSGPSSPGAPSGPGGGQGCQASHWGQCGGKNWNGCTSCIGGTTCRYQNDYYSQCL